MSAPQAYPPVRERRARLNGAVEGVPFVQRDLDWVRIAQRFPVRIVVENPDPAVFRSGTTAVTTIKGYTQSGDRK